VDWQIAGGVETPALGAGFISDDYSRFHFGAARHDEVFFFGSFTVTNPLAGLGGVPLS